MMSFINYLVALLGDEYSFFHVALGIFVYIIREGHCLSALSFYSHWGH